MVEQRIICPKCGAKIPLTEAISRQIREELSKEFEASTRQKEQSLIKTEKNLVKREKAIEERSKSIDKLIAKKLADEKKRIEREVKKEVKDDVSLEMKDLNQQLEEYKKKLKDVEKTELNLRKQKREIEQKQESFELEMVRKLDEESELIREEAVKKATEEHRLKDREKDKMMNDMKQQLEDLKRKVEQGSQQLQGEVLEIEIEDLLKASFPQDNIEPVPKGMKGADILHHVHEPSGQHSGTIIWESKRRKNWSDSWIEKLKDDQRAARAEIAIIVSTTLPKDIANFDIKNGVWITNYDSIIGLATALRFNLIQISKAKIVTEGKQEKMDVLYNYMCGTQFKHRVEAVVESFLSMKKDLDKEKVAMTKQWAKREKEIERVINNVAGMYGDMQGIIGSSLPQIESLELKALPFETSKL